jgi:hypothetical protein
MSSATLQCITMQQHDAAVRCCSEVSHHALEHEFMLPNDSSAAAMQTSSIYNMLLL